MLMGPRVVVDPVTSLVDPCCIVLTSGTRSPRRVPDTVTLCLSPVLNRLRSWCLRALSSPNRPVLTLPLPLRSGTDKFTALKAFALVTVTVSAVSPVNLCDLLSDRPSWLTGLWVGAVLSRLFCSFLADVLVTFVLLARRSRRLCSVLFVREHSLLLIRLVLDFPSMCRFKTCPQVRLTPKVYTAGSMR